MFRMRCNTGGGGEAEAEAELKYCVNRGQRAAGLGVCLSDFALTEPSLAISNNSSSSDRGLI